MMDERGQVLVARAMALTLAFLYLFLFVYCVQKYVMTADITEVTFELILIVMIPFAIQWFARKDERLLIPRMYATTQKKLPTELDVKTKRTRRKYYFLDSVAFAAVFLMLTIADALFVQKQWDVINVFPHLSHPVNVVVTLAFEFFLGVIVFYIISYIWGEWLIKIYNRKLEKLDKDE